MKRDWLSFLALSLVLTAACQDTTASAPPPGPKKVPRGDSGVTVARFHCTASATSLNCVDADAASAGDNARRVILGGGRVKLVSTNVVSDTIAEDLSADITVQNLQPYPIGTTNGTNVAFIKVFFHEGPTVTAYRTPGDTGTVYMSNADGTCNCSGPNQPYYSYPQILQTNQVSAAKKWHFHVPRSVNNFTFQLYVFTRYPGEADIAATPPDTVPEWVYDSTKIVYGD